MIVTLLIAQIIINSYSFGTTSAVGGTGFMLQEDGTFMMQQDGTSKMKKEFTAGGFMQQQDGFFMMQQDGTSKMQQQ